MLAVTVEESEAGGGEEPDGAEGEPGERRDAQVGAGVVEEAAGEVAEAAAEGERKGVDAEVGAEGGGVCEASGDGLLAGHGEECAKGEADDAGDEGGGGGGEGDGAESGGHESEAEDEDG